MTTPPNANPQEQSIGELFVDVSKDISLLIRQEIELAKAELRESATTAGKGAGELGGAAVAAHLGLVFLSIALWWAIGNSTGRGWAGLIIGVVYLIIAGALAAVGRKDMKAVKGLPQTTGTVKQIPDAMKGNEGVR
ncbi:MAG TPA: phage holin family protein [Kineosporiaceae bacterium]|nr:phage holin family protein [Kineosporiaceae bacterium]